FMLAMERVVLSGIRDTRCEMRDEPAPGAVPDPSDGPHPVSRIPHHASRLVLFIDEIDVVRSLPFSTDEFFAAIRECYNRRAREPAFERLTFCLLGVASPSDLVRDPRRAPFNIGRRIQLTDFTEAEAAPLALGLCHHGAAPLRGTRLPSGETRRGIGKNGKRRAGDAKALMRRILYWTGGHPYLTQR